MVSNCVYCLCVVRAKKYIESLFRRPLICFLEVYVRLLMFVTPKGRANATVAGVALISCALFLVMGVGSVLRGSFVLAKDFTVFTCTFWIDVMSSVTIFPNIYPSMRPM